MGEGVGRLVSFLSNLDPGWHSWDMVPGVVTQNPLILMLFSKIFLIDMNYMYLPNETISCIRGDSTTPPILFLLIQLTCTRKGFHVLLHFTHWWSTYWVSTMCRALHAYSGNKCSNISNLSSKTLWCAEKEGHISNFCTASTWLQSVIGAQDMRSSFLDHTERYFGSGDT